MVYIKRSAQSSICNNKFRPCAQIKVTHRHRILQPTNSDPHRYQLRNRVIGYGNRIEPSKEYHPSSRFCISKYLHSTVLLCVSLHLDAPRSMPRRQPDTTMSAIMHHILQARHQEGDTPETQTHAETEGPGTTRPAIVSIQPFPGDSYAAGLYALSGVPALKIHSSHLPRSARWAVNRCRKGIEGLKGCGLAVLRLFLHLYGLLVGLSLHHGLELSVRGILRIAGRFQWMFLWRARMGRTFAEELSCRIRGRKGLRGVREDLG